MRRLEIIIKVNKTIRNYFLFLFYFFFKKTCSMRLDIVNHIKKACSMRPDIHNHIPQKTACANRTILNHLSSNNLILKRLPT